MNQLRVNDIADAQARKMIAKHPECRRSAVCIFVLRNAKTALEMDAILRTLEAGLMETVDVAHILARMEQQILADFRRTFGHDMIAPPEPDHDSTN